MLRKFAILAAMMAAVALTATGLSIADEDSPIHKLMEKVNQHSNAVKKAVRTPVAFKKAHSQLAKHAYELIKLGKDARDMKGPAETQKKDFAAWQKLCDEYIKKTEEFKDVIADKSATQDAAKKAFTAVGATCSSCHKDFRVEDEK